MRRPSLPRRRKRNRLANAVEQIVLRVLAVVWVVRLLARHGRVAAR